MKNFLIISLLAFFASLAFGQSNEVPAPPPSGGATVAENAPPSPAYEENVRPLSGVQSFDLGIRTDHLNMVSPTFTFSETYGTNPGLTNGPQSETVWGSTINIGGGLKLTSGSANKLFSMSYLGSAQFSSYDSNLNTHVHSFDLMESITRGRWSYVVGDTLAYQPNAYGGNGAILFPGSGLGAGSGFRTGIGPESTILTEQNPQLSNTALGQVSYGLSRASVLTGSVSYGILHYLDGDFLDTRQLNATGGYDHKFGRNTVGVAYTYSKFMYSNFAQDFDTNTVQLTYGHRLLGRVSFSGGIGPTFRTTRTGAISTNTTDISGQANLTYAGSRTGVSLSYSRLVTAGSGVTPGALTDQASVSADRQLTHALSGNMSGGFSRNSSLFTGIGNDYNTWYIGTGVARKFGQFMSVSLGYRGQRQTSNLAVSNLSTHSFVASLMWHLRPIRLK